VLSNAQKRVSGTGEIQVSFKGPKLGKNKEKTKKPKNTKNMIQYGKQNRAGVSLIRQVAPI